MSELSQRKIEDLSPIDSVSLSDYDRNILDQVFDPGNDRIKNIAITGPYASGKSSYVESYKKDRIQRQEKPISFVHISLAHFGDAAEEKNITDYNIEKKIVNQLIHSLPKKDREAAVRQLNGVILTEQNKKKLRFFVIEILCIFSTIVYFSNFELIGKILKLPERISAFLPVILGFLCMLSVGHILYRILYEKPIHFQLKKVNIGISEIESDQPVSDSYFDNHLEEILYIFEKCDADVFVFEDIDRFNKTTIFERLREINSLLNNRLNCKKSFQESFIEMAASPDQYDIIQVVKFAYLLKDDIFDSVDRQKFFDYIIPIMPQLNPSNVMDKIAERTDILIPETDSKGSFAWNKLTIYIRNMRMLINICNEYNAFNQRIRKDESFKDYKLMAIILYKNYFPEDFSRLYANDGFIFEVMHYSKRDAGVTVAELIDSGKLIIDTNNHPDKEYLETIQKSKHYKMLEMFLRYGFIEDDYLDYITGTTKSDSEESEPALIPDNGSNDPPSLDDNHGQTDKPSDKEATSQSDRNLRSTDLQYYKNIIERTGYTISSDISNPQFVLDKLTPSDLSCAEALNLSILEYLLENDMWYYLRHMLYYAQIKLEIIFLAKACKKLANKNDFIKQFDIKAVIENATTHSNSYIVSSLFEESLRLLKLYGYAYGRYYTLENQKEFAGIAIENANLSGADLSKLDLSDSSFSYCDFGRANLSGSYLKRSSIINCTYSDAILSGADYSGAKLNTVDFSKADLTHSYFRDAKITSVSYNKAFCKDIAFTNAIIMDSSFTSTDLSGAQFAFATLSYVDLKDALNIDKTYGLDDIYKNKLA